MYELILQIFVWQIQFFEGKCEPIAPFFFLYLLPENHFRKMKDCFKDRENPVLCQNVNHVIQLIV